MAATAAAAAAGRGHGHAQPALSSEDLSSVLPGRSFTLRVVDAFFSSVLPAVLQAEGAGNNLQRCLVPPPGVLGALQCAILGAPRMTGMALAPEVQRWWEAHNPFSQQFMMLPLVDSEHASLLIVCQLGACAAGGQGRPVGTSGSSSGSSGSCIVHLDSLHAKGGGHEPNFHEFRAMLKDAARVHGAANDIELTEANLPAVSASVPQQRSADGSGASYMCTNALYFLANLPPVVDATAVAQLAQYRVHLRDLFEGTPHCYPGFLTRDWYPGNVPESLRKRVLQGLMDLIQEQYPKPAERDGLLQHAQGVMAQLRAASKRPFEMPEKRRQKQQQEKEERRRRAGMGGQSGQPPAAGVAAAQGPVGIAGAGASPYGAPAAGAAADGEGVRGGSAAAGPSGGDQQGRAAPQLRPRSARRSLVADESDGEERQPPSGSARPVASSDDGSDYVPSQDSEGSSAALHQVQHAPGGAAPGSTKRRASDVPLNGSPPAKKQHGNEPAGPVRGARTASGAAEHAALAQQENEAAAAALPLQQAPLAGDQQAAGCMTPGLGPAAPTEACARAVPAVLERREQPPPLPPQQQQHVSATEQQPVQLQPASSRDAQARLQQVLASMAAAESADEQHRPQQQRAAVRDALQLLGSKARWKACLKRFSALLLEEQDVKFVALHEQLQDAEDRAAVVDRWVQEQLG